jgi:hypothetical protein
VVSVTRGMGTKPSELEAARTGAAAVARAATREWLMAPDRLVATALAIGLSTGATDFPSWTLRGRLPGL